MILSSWPTRRRVYQEEKSNDNQYFITGRKNNIVNKIKLSIKNEEKDDINDKISFLSMSICQQA